LALLRPRTETGRPDRPKCEGQLIKRDRLEGAGLYVGDEAKDEESDEDGTEASILLKRFQQSKPGARIARLVRARYDLPNHHRARQVKTGRSF